jgi:hypothetical protein
MRERYGAATASVLPMEIQIGDRFTDAEGEFEVVSHPAALQAGKSLRTKVRRVGEPATERTVTWPAPVKLDIQRNPSKCTRADRRAHSIRHPYGMVTTIG